MGRFENIADVSFIDGITLSGLISSCSELYRERYAQLTGSDAAIPVEEQCHIYAYCMQLYQMAHSINEKGKQNFLNYATGDFLDNLALTRGITRKSAECAAVSVKFELSEARPSAVVIPQGTRVTSSAAAVYFATGEYAEIAAGDTEITLICTALTGGAAGNNFAVGEINTLVDTIAYISSVSNTEVPTGGADREDDDTLAQRVYDSKSVYSTAGSEDAYKYYIKEFSSLIEDIYIDNPSDADIDVYILMKDRQDASSAFIEELTEYIQDPSIRAMTDNITVYNAPTTEYSVNVTYYIPASQSGNVTAIQAAVIGAVENYKEWQSARIGRDINPQKLISLMIEAGAKRVVLSSSELVSVGADHVARCTGTSITYAGLEAD